MRTLIFAAGLGTRLKPITDTLPKALAPVGGRPLIDIVMSRLQKAGCDDFVVNVHYFADKVKSWVSENSERFGNIAVSDESDELLETGGGLRKAAPLLTAGGNTHFLIHNVDILSNVDLAAMWTAQPDADALLLVSSRETARYLVFDERMLLCGWVNIQTGEVRTQDELLRSHLSQLEVGQLEVGGYRLRAFAGIHIMQTSMLERFDSYPEKCSIIDFYLGECGHCTIMGYEQEGLRLLDVGKLTTLQDAEAYVRNLG